MADLERLLVRLIQIGLTAISAAGLIGVGWLEANYQHGLPSVIDWGSE